MPFEVSCKKRSLQIPTPDSAHLTVDKLDLWHLIGHVGFVHIHEDPE